MPLLNAAAAMYVGDLLAQKVYLGDTLVWSAGPPPWTGWTPAGMTGLVTWLDASDVGAITTQWPDKSGQGHHGAIVGSPSPAVVANSPSKRNVVRFSAGQGMVRGTIPDLTMDFTIIYVSRMVGPTVGRVFGTNLDAGKNYWLGFHTTGMDGWMYGNGSMYKAPTAYSGLPSAWRLYTASAGVASGNQSSALWADGVSLAAYAGGPVDLGPGTTYNLSGYQTTGTGETSDSEVAELLIFNRGLNYTERRQVETYLVEKWGLAPLPPLNPASIPGCALALDASALLLLDGEQVTLWPDASPLGHSMVLWEGGSGAPAGTAPTFRTGVQNGHPVVRFTSGNVLTTQVQPPAYKHIFMVARYQDAAFGDYNGLLTGHDGNEIIFIGNGPGTTLWYLPPWTGSYRFNGVLYGGGAWPAPMAVFGMMDFAASTSWPLARTRIGLDRVYPPRYWHGDVAEVLAYDRVLSEPERLEVEKHLMSKWAIRAAP